MLNESLFSSNRMDWRTPKKLFDALNAEFAFNLDAAADDDNAKCSMYFTKNDDALSRDWSGYTVFCNPPYGRNLGAWVAKGHAEGKKPNTTVVMLIPARPDTAYWHDHILHGHADEIRFLRGRVRFEDESNTPAGPAPFPSAVVIWRSK